MRAIALLLKPGSSRCTLLSRLLLLDRPPLNRQRTHNRCYTQRHRHIQRLHDRLIIPAQYPLQPVLPNHLPQIRQPHAFQPRAVRPRRVPVHLVDEAVLEQRRGRADPERGAHARAEAEEGAADGDVLGGEAGLDGDLGALDADADGGAEEAEEGGGFDDFVVQVDGCEEAGGDRGEDAG